MQLPRSREQRIEPLRDRLAQPRLSLVHHGIDHSRRARALRPLNTLGPSRDKCAQVIQVLGAFQSIEPEVRVTAVVCRGHVHGYL